VLVLNINHGKLFRDVVFALYTTLIQVSSSHTYRFNLCIGLVFGILIQI